MLFVRHEELEAGGEGASAAAAGVRQAGGGDALALVATGMPGSTSAGAATSLAAHFTGAVTRWAADADGHAQALRTASSTFAAVDDHGAGAMLRAGQR